MRVVEVERPAPGPVDLLDDRNPALRDQPPPLVVLLDGDPEAGVDRSLGSMRRQRSAPAGPPGLEQQQDTGADPVEQGTIGFATDPPQPENSGVKRLGAWLVGEVQHGLQDSGDRRSLAGRFHGSIMNQAVGTRPSTSGGSCERTTSADTLTRMSETHQIVLLGPQRFQPNLHEALEALRIKGPLAVITAGWQEREAEVDELREHVGIETVHLDLHRRQEQVEQDDPELGDALHDRQRQLRRLQRLYRMRLDHALAPARRLIAKKNGDAFTLEHRDAAIRQLRTLDRQHLVRIRKLRREFDEQWQPWERTSVSRQRSRIEERIQGCSALAIAGGNVATLLNRMLLFGIREMLDDLPVVAWSAGAMALGEQVVLFHDNPPQGQGNAEVFDAGIGLYRNVVPLPHARQRLRLEDPTRVALLARRFAPARCVPLDPGDRLMRDHDRWEPGNGTRVLTRGGAVRRMVVR